MKLFTFGDSWTEGVGSDWQEELKTEDLEERTKIRHKYAWPTLLSKHLNIPFDNFGIGGCSNKSIFDAVCNSVDTDLIKKDDLVVIMWSSSLRDSVPFFPDNNSWHYWGERYKRKEYLYKKVFKNTNITTKYDRIKKEYQEYFLANLFTDEYYQIVNQNYILYLQWMFKKIGIRYIFCDAFDLMIKDDISKNIDKTNLIDKNHYWGISNKTLKDLLINTNRKDVWGDGQHWKDLTEGKHPNKNGYKLIANELYDFILNKNILTYKTNNIENIII